MPFLIVGFYRNEAVIILTGGRDLGHWGGESWNQEDTGRYGSLRMECLRGYVGSESCNRRLIERSIVILSEAKNLCRLPVSEETA